MMKFGTYVRLSDKCNTSHEQNYIFYKNSRTGEKMCYEFYRLNSSNIEILNCEICYEPKNSWICLNTCKHKLCYDCFENIIINKYKDEFFKFDLNNIINNMYITCPFCRSKTILTNISHYTKTKLSIRVWDLINNNKNNKIRTI